jgi:hypothetical protein
MSLSHMKKVDSKCGNFQEKWTDKYFCDSVNGKAFCLIYNEIIAVLRECNLAME